VNVRDHDLLDAIEAVLAHLLLRALPQQSPQAGVSLSRGILHVDDHENRLLRHEVKAPTEL
jgi:hypothetical protein